MIINIALEVPCLLCVMPSLERSDWKTSVTSLPSSAVHKLGCVSIYRIYSDMSPNRLFFPKALWVHQEDSCVSLNGNKQNRGRGIPVLKIHNENGSVSICAGETEFVMQRITCLATSLELGGIVGCKPLACPWKRSPPTLPPHAQLSSLAFLQPCNSRLLERTLQPQDHRSHNWRGQNTSFVSQKCRYYSTDSDNEPKTSPRQPAISVVGIPDPITWIRNKIIILFIELYFDLNISSVEFDTGVKQAVIHVSSMVSSGKFWAIRDVVSAEAVRRVKRKYEDLTDTQRRNLAISSDDIVFVLPEDVSVVFDTTGRKFCSIIMRLWHLTDADVPEDPESTRIFSITDHGEDPPKKIVTAVYEFHRELTTGADPDWMVTHIWHWKQLE